MQPPPNPNINAEELFQSIKARIMSVLNQAWSEFKSPTELTSLSRRFNKFCEYRGVHFADIVDELKARGLVHVIMLPTLKRFVVSKECWETVNEKEREELTDLLLNTHAKPDKKGHVEENPNLIHKRITKPFFTVPKLESLPIDSTESENS